MHSYDVCECGAPLQRMERETPQPKGSDVVLKVLAAGGMVITNSAAARS